MIIDSSSQKFNKVAQLEHEVNILKSKKAYLESMLNDREEEIAFPKKIVEVENNGISLLE